ncbi:MAG: hypothetical protein LBD53_01555 [Tannerella sp.]|jgi:hypothetical protein|nr:hypothetical protein [Tannerella sp.]
MGRHLIAPTLIMTDVSSKPLAGFKTTARVLGTVITYRLVLSFLLAMTNAIAPQTFLNRQFHNSQNFMLNLQP